MSKYTDLYIALPHEDFLTRLKAAWLYIWDAEKAARAYGTIGSRCKPTPKESKKEKLE